MRRGRSHPTPTRATALPTAATAPPGRGCSAPPRTTAPGAAGVLVAAWNNGAGGAREAPNARFVALRPCWGDDQCYQYVQAAAFNWAADRGARVVSMSYLEDSDPANQEEGFADAITSHPNVLFVAIPSGNGPTYDVEDPVAQQNNSGSAFPPWPCSLNAPNVLCVTT